MSPRLDFSMWSGVPRWPVAVNSDTARPHASLPLGIVKQTADGEYPEYEARMIIACGSPPTAACGTFSTLAAAIASIVARQEELLGTTSEDDRIGWVPW